RSPPKMRIRSSSRARKKRDEPGSPWRPLRPRSWLSIRRLSCRSVPTMCRPPPFATPSPSTMSVPRPAMLVAMVTAPAWPALATIKASRSCCLALSTSCGTPRFSSNRASRSDFSTDTVPTRTGRPVPAVRPAPARLLPAGELVDDDDFAVLDEVVAVALEEGVGFQRLVDLMGLVHVLQLVDILDPGPALDLRDPILGQRCGFRLLV